MSPQKELPPSQYNGRDLCPFCGDDGTGRFYAICAGSSYSHEESCALYTYGDLCEKCDASLRAEFDGEVEYVR